MFFPCSYQSLNPLSFMEGLQTNPSFITLASPFISRGDYENYIDRLIRLTTQVSSLWYSVNLDKTRDVHPIRWGHGITRILTSNMIPIYRKNGDLSFSKKLEYFISLGSFSSSLNILEPLFLMIKWINGLKCPDATQSASYY